jgi:hypothetical protein
MTCGNNTLNGALLPFLTIMIRFLNDTRAIPAQDSEARVASIGSIAKAASDRTLQLVIVVLLYS